MNVDIDHHSSENPPAGESGGFISPEAYGAQIFTFPRAGEVPVSMSLGDAKDGYERVMVPSFSTRLLIGNMMITPGEHVLDWGTGTGAVGIAAYQLGAGQVTMSDVYPECAEVTKRNVELNKIVNGCRIVVANMFDAFRPNSFDHIICNPPSIPSLKKRKKIPSYSRSGPDGRQFHNEIQKLAGEYLTFGGRLTFVQGSLSNKQLSLDNLKKMGFQEIKTIGFFRNEFASWYDKEHIEKLAFRNKAQFEIKDGRYSEYRYVISAVLKK